MERNVWIPRRGEIANAKPAATRHGYPSHVVVPYVLETRVILEALIPCWNNGRFPVWCWSSSYGSALLRSSYCCNDIESEDPWDIISPLIAKVHPRTRRPRILDVESSSAMIASSYQKLRELCSIETSSQFSRLEKKWYSLMDETGWCALVYSCLHSARKVIHLLIDNQQSVVVTDEDGFGASTVVCCLAQICVDEYYRTVEGLNRLIDREWSAMGYPFGQNMFKRGDSVHNEPQNEAPTVATFLLFLDAVSQLIRLHPYSFEYSQYMLIALWDLSITGIAPGLTFNTVDERIAENRLEPTFPLSKYYSSKYCLMFANVDYCTGCVCGIAETKETIIRPSSCPADVEFWTDCYLRWVPPANIMNGGKVAHDIAQSSTLSATVAVDCDPIVWRQEHHPGFEYDDIASSFPFSNTVFTVSSNTNNERMNMDDTASLCSLGTNIDLFGPNINSTKGQKRAERRYSTSSMLSRMSDLVDRAKGDHATRYNPRLHELNPHRNVSCLPEYVESSSNPVLRYSSALEPSANQCSSSYDTRLPNSAFDTLV
ncbi:hypothetical protein AB6A40_001421 [Gnathostoma spinigerum]|uniref:Myotubularin phosphatase domain-containing protein n=1 Tax=Gnathostoma spinigerum TaxID=75299 RepID=A0ABD6E677_9BILA